MTAATTVTTTSFKGLLILIIDYNLINEDASGEQTNKQGVIGDAADGCRVRGAVGV